MKAARDTLKALTEEHQRDGSLLWTSPGQTAIERLRNTIEDAEKILSDFP